jgi:hypothetical protein
MMTVEYSSGSCPAVIKPAKRPWLWGGIQGWPTHATLRRDLPRIQAKTDEYRGLLAQFAVASACSTPMPGLSPAFQSIGLAFLPWLWLAGYLPRPLAGRNLLKAMSDPLDAGNS